MKTFSGLFRNEKAMVVRLTVAAVGFVAFLSVTFLSVAFLPLSARAEKMDAEIHTVVIEKMERSLKSAHEDSNFSLRPVRARLADLYAERARLRSMDEAERDCTSCTGARDDRQKALKLYDVVLKESSPQNRGTLMLQMAHLRELGGDFKKSENLYDQMLREGRGKHSSEMLAEAYIGRAEARFSRGDVDRAQDDFEAALKLVGKGRKGQILNRIAWCHLNKGDNEKAIQTLVRILQTPDLLTRESSGGTEYDASFHEDVARDLATFLARDQVGPSEIQRIEALAPERAKKETLKHFASECERLGQKKAAIEVWTIEAKYETKPIERLEALVRIAQIRFDLGERKEALNGLRAATAEWSKNGCSDGEVCDALKLRLRNLVIAWNKSEKKQPTGLLMEAYLAYVGVFADDMEMTQWAAEAASAQKRHGIAGVLFAKSADLAAKSTQKNAKAMLDSGLVGEVEMAEISKDLATREAAYNHYLALNPNGAIAAKIRYQHARVAYERGDMNEASRRFHDFAISPLCRSQVNRRLCIQAADLDLDALVGAKAHATVQARAGEYGRLFGERRDEYAKISRTAVLKQAEVQDPAAAMVKLAEADLTGASTEERVRLLKTQIAVAEKARDLAAVKRAASALGELRGVSVDDREFALGKQAWAAEMSLDFEQAYRITRAMNMKSLRPDERAMKLALLAELAGRDPRAHELEFLKVSRDQFQKAFVMAKLVRASARPEAEFARYENSLRAYPTLVANLSLQIFGKNGNIAFAQRVLKNRRVAAEPAGRVLARELYLREFAVLNRTIVQHRLSAANEKLMQRSLAERFQLLARADKIANVAIGSKDWAAQIISLSALARENLRVYNEIVALPAPKKLKGEQRRKYQQMVEASARSYLHKQQSIDRKLNTLWGDADSQRRLEQDLRDASPVVRPLVANEIHKLIDVAPNGIRRELEDHLRNGSRIPSEQQLAQARQEAKSSPFNTESLAKLRDLENVRGRETMVSYLDTRLLVLQNKAGSGSSLMGMGVK